MKKFLYAHYEKIILAALLIIFTALLYYSLMFIQRAQNQEVATKVKPVQKPSDYTPIDFSSSKYKMETIFSDWNTVEVAQPSRTATQLMAPYPMAECVHCHALIPVDSYPAIGETKNGKCPACGKALEPRIKIEIDALGKNDVNSNNIPDDWEREFSIAEEFTSPDSDQDSDGFTLEQEYKAKTDPTDPLSHPKYITQIYVDAIRQERFTGLELVSVDMTKSDKKDWQATFNVVRNSKKKTEFVRINVGTFKNNNVDFSLVDVEVDDKTQEPVAYVQRVGKVERIPCYVKKPVYDPMPRVRFINALYKNRTFISSVGSNFKIGTAKTGEELYNVISADPATKEVVVESDSETPETFKLQAAPKDVPAAGTGSSAIPGAPPVDNKKDSSPFLKRQ